MKAGLLCLAGLAVAQPHRRHHHQRRAVVYDVVTEVDVATATAVDAMVYVNQNGDPTATSYLTGEAAATSTSSLDKVEHYHSPEGYHHESSSSSVYVAPTTASSSSVYVAPTPSSTSTSVYVAPTPYSTSTSVYVAPTTSSASVYVASTTAAASPTSEEASISAPAPVTEASSSASAPSSYSEASSTASAPATYSSSSSSSGRGVTYSPYRADNTCKTTEEVATDFAQLGEFSLVRTYGTDCNQVANVLAAMTEDMKLFAGVYDITDVSNEIDIIISAVNNDWSSIDTISIGNELVQNAMNANPDSSAAVAQVVTSVANAVASARSQLTDAKYTGSIVTVDTIGAIIANKDTMCDIGDHIAANCHAFFDGNIVASLAGEFVHAQMESVYTTCKNKRTVITESGWPSQGEANVLAVPSETNQQAAISSLKSAFTSDIFLFNAYNDLWKSPTAKGTFGAEQYWGIYGDSAAN